MPFYRICPHCRSYLDFGERCDCRDEEKAAPVLEHRNGQKVESESPNPHSTSIVQKDKEEIKHENDRDLEPRYCGI